MHPDGLVSGHLAEPSTLRNRPPKLARMLTSALSACQDLVVLKLLIAFHADVLAEGC